MRLVGILGGGESGTGAALLAKQQGFDIWLSDAGEIKAPFRTELMENQIPFEEGKHTIEKFFDAEVVIKSPGIPGEVPIVRALRARQIPVISELEFAARCTKAKLIAVTGSNGKTTTTSLIYQLLLCSGYDVGVGGNIGKSFARILTESAHEIYVLEVSSFQLDDIEQFKPDVALLLNITPDHLDRYGGSLTAYGRAKLRIQENQKAGDRFIFWGEDPEIQRLLNPQVLSGKTLERFGFDKDTRLAAWTEGQELVFRDGFRFDFDHMQLMGKHNMLNSLAAILAVRAVGVGGDQLARCLARFQAIEHRLEKVAEKAGVLYVNDSKATNVDAVFYALEGMRRPVIWIAGGVDKGNDYHPLQALVKKKVKALICLGDGEAQLRAAFETPFYKANSMAEAVSSAVSLAEKGDVVLLAPACASFDLFQNYEDRGLQFKAEVHALANHS